MANLYWYLCRACHETWRSRAWEAYECPICKDLEIEQISDE